jgi:hypothetical protein
MSFYPMRGEWRILSIEVMSRLRLEVVLVVL